MLVLSRRPNETVVFPGLGVTIELLKIRGNIARVGIKAPRDLEILRGELVSDDPHLKLDVTGERMLRKTLTHEMRNHLNLATVGLGLLRRQLVAGQTPEANMTVQRVLEQLSVLEQNVEKVEGVAVARRALLVEDDDNERELLAAFLRSSGIEVDTADDGSMALDYLSKQPRPDVVLMDMLMPRCDGPTTVRAIRGNPQMKGLKIYAVSGASPRRLGLDTGPTGIDRWFQKPLNPETLVDEISRDLTPAA